MSQQKYRAKEKIVSKMTREGLVEENLSTRSRENVSKQIKEADVHKPQERISFVEKNESKAEEKLERIRKKQPQKHSLKVQKVYEEESKKIKYKLYFEDVPKTSKKKGVGKFVAQQSKNSLQRAVHERVREAGKENVAVEASHKAEQMVENAVFMGRTLKRYHYNRRASHIKRLERSVSNASIKYQYAKFMEEYPQMQRKSVLNKFYQKKWIKREYQKAYKNRKSGTKVTGKSVEVTTKIAKKIQDALIKNKTMLMVGLAIGMILIFIVAGFSSCSMVFTDTVAPTIFSSWMSKPAEIDKADLLFSQKEVELQNQIDRIERDYQGYDEYRYNVGAIGHNPMELISYLSAKYVDFTHEAVIEEVEWLFGEMYQLSTREVIEIRTRKEMQNVTVVDPITGAEMQEEREVEVEYEYRILEVTLVAKSLSSIIGNVLTTEQRELYDVYRESNGGLQQLGTPLSLAWYGYISSYYGYRKHPVSGEEQFHRGLDIAVPTGTDVLSGHTGVVTEAAYHKEYGNYIVIADEEGYISKYARLSTVGVAVGQRVEIGVRIGKTGNTGSSSGSHLHIEVLYEGEYYNPLFYFQIGEGTLYGESTDENGEAIPPEAYDEESVARLFREANRYLGMPYTFGGTPPTSFDCSAFVCWVFSNSGVYDLPRTTAQGIYEKSSPIEAGEAKAGDIIFFTGTYNAGRPVTHVGIYCGNGMMVHCGDPIAYTSITTSYWQSHFYGFGRLE